MNNPTAPSPDAVSVAREALDKFTDAIPHGAENAIKAAAALIEAYATTREQKASEKGFEIGSERFKKACELKVAQARVDALENATGEEITEARRRKEARYEADLQRVLSALKQTNREKK